MERRLHMSRSLTPRSSLDNLRKEARRWLAALQAGDPQARSRLLAATPAAPAEPGLRDVQHALAREYGLAGWSALRRALDDLASDRQSLEKQVDIVLRSVMWQASTDAASRILKRVPAIATADLYMAASTGSLAELERRLATEPGAAQRKGGPLDWEPLLYLAYSRLPVSETNALPMARLLLAGGADPNASWTGPWGPPAFTVLTGLIGEGEAGLPPHPQAMELATLLIDAGADPYDPQALYNTSIVGDDVTWLEFLWDQSERRGRQEAWREVGGATAIGGQRPVNALDYLLGNATAANHLRRADWLLAHGANADSLHAYSGRPQREEALVQGYEEMASLLTRHGAARTPLTEKDAFRSACLRGDRDAARELLGRHPGFLDDGDPLRAAAGRGRADLVALMLDLGFDVDDADATATRPLHKAIAAGSLESVKLLVAHGADVDRRTLQHGGPMGFACHFERREIAQFLAPRSRDVHCMTWLGFKTRLAELFEADPTLVNAVEPSLGLTPLFALPDDEDEAVDMATFLLSHGADPSIRNDAGMTAEESQRQAGLVDIADFLHAWRSRRMSS